VVGFPPRFFSYCAALSACKFFPPLKLPHYLLRYLPTCPGFFTGTRNRVFSGTRPGFLRNEVPGFLRKRDVKLYDWWVRWPVPANLICLLLRQVPENIDDGIEQWAILGRVMNMEVQWL